MKRIKVVVQKALAINSQPTEESFPELPEVLIWFRFVLGLSYGLFLGLKDLRSGTIILQGLNFIVFVPMVYARFYLGADQEIWGAKLVFAGTFHAMALCMLIWIYLYTAQHEEEEGLLAAMLAMRADEESADKIVETEANAPEESEF